MKADKTANGKYFGSRNGVAYEIKDDSAAYFHNVWENNSPAATAKEVLGNEELWGTDLTKLPGFLQTVQEQLQDMISNGALNTIARLTQKKVTA
jgi:tagaturonate reductase